jgi:DNA-binding MarR family transcriptional regulator
MTEQTHAANAVTLAEELRSFGARLKRLLRNQADVGDLTPSQIAVILRLEKDGPATTSALAREAGMRPQSMGTTIAALEALGMVSGAPDAVDGRQTILSLTEHCRAGLIQGRAMRQDWLARTIDDRLSPHEQAQLDAAMPLLRRLVEE